MLRAALVGALALCSITVCCRADSIEDFYRGRQIQMLVHESAGSSYDAYARLLAQYMGRYIPGDPSFLVENMPGSGGIRVANFIEAAAPKDGTVIGTAGAGLLIDQALHLTPSLVTHLRQLKWLGSMSDSNSVIVTWKTSQTKTLTDAKSRSTILAVGDAGALGVQAPIMLNAALGTWFKLVRGYSSEEQGLAMERGEAEGRGAFPWSGYKSLHPGWIRDRDLNVLVQVGARKEPDLPNVPLACDLGDSAEHKQMLQFLCGAVALGRPFFLASGVPGDRVETLRKAFQEALKDKDLMAEARREGLDIRLTSGNGVTRIVSHVLDTSPAALGKIRDVLEVDGQHG